MAAKLILIYKGVEMGEFPLTKEVTTIGRKNGNDIKIDDLSVSGAHAQVLTILTDSFLEDLDSTNGTFVNGKAIKKRALQDQDLVTVGKYQLRYINEDASTWEDFDKTVVLNPEAMGMTERAAADNQHIPDRKDVVDANASLELQSGPNAGRSLKLTKALTKIGKAGGQVAAISKRAQGFFIVNVSSDPSVGSPVVNDEPVGTRSQLLKEGDVITLAGEEMTFHIG